MFLRVLISCQAYKLIVGALLCPNKSKSYFFTCIGVGQILSSLGLRLLSDWLHKICNFTLCLDYESFSYERMQAISKNEAIDKCNESNLVDPLERWSHGHLKLRGLQCTDDGTLQWVAGKDGRSHTWIFCIILMNQGRRRSGSQQLCISSNCIQWILIRRYD